eukprot:8703076-Ditylum_brightwellii.AAC.1
MKDIARKFIRHKIDFHEEGIWVILFCNNLVACIDDSVRQIFEDAQVFLCYFPPDMTNFIQLIDAGLRWSVCISIENFLDQWLMNSGNFEKWESTFIDISFIKNRIRGLYQDRRAAAAYFT